MKHEKDEDKKAVFGIYSNRAAAERGVEKLKVFGFSSSEISVLMPEVGGSKKFAHKNSTKTPEGATAGAGTGLVVGGTLGWLVGMGALAIPGLGPLIAAGPIVAMLAGAGAGAAVGGLTGALIGMGIPEYEARRYESHIKSGGILLSVHTGNSESAKAAKMVLEQTGATEIATSGEVSATPAKTSSHRSVGRHI